MRVATKNSGFCRLDAAGNLKHQGPCPGSTYAYDAENRLTSTASVTYSYDGDGKRVMKSNGKLYWYGMSSDPLLETDAAGNNSTEFVFFNGKRIARRDPSGSIYYFFADHLDSARVVTNSTGTVVEESDYYPFGAERIVVDTLDNQYKFTGKERDAESFTDYFHARQYAYLLGRFLQPDEFTGGPVDAFSSSDPLPPSPLPYADIINPQSLNKYAYTLNNPLRYTDPSGHCFSGTVDTLICVAVAALVGYAVYNFAKSMKKLEKTAEEEGAKIDQSYERLERAGQDPTIDVDEEAEKIQESQLKVSRAAATAALDAAGLPGTVTGGIPKPDVTTVIQGVAIKGMTEKAKAEAQATEQK